jgi:pimeloyl-ACP methyl ester carboxylesterase
MKSPQGRYVNVGAMCRAHQGDFTHPVLVIWGREDPIVLVAHAQVAEKGFPDVCVCILQRCGHVPMLEHPQAFNEMVTVFCRGMR